MKTLKVIISLVLIICLVSSFMTVTAYAVVDPATVAVGGGLAALIASLLGIDYLSNGLDESSLTAFFNKRTPSDPNLALFTANIIVDPVGTIRLFINKAFFDYFKDTNENIVNEFDITNNFTGRLQQGTGFYNGVPIFQNGNRLTSDTYNFNFGDQLVLGNTAFTYIPHFSSYYYLSYLSRADSSSIINTPASFYIQKSSSSWQYVLYSATNSTTSGLVYTTQYKNIDNRLYIEENFSLDVETGNIDFTVGDDLPASGGLVITAPNPGDILDVESLIHYLINLLLNDPEELETELVEEEPAPDTGPTIADTPFIDLIGLFRTLGDKIEDVVQDVIGLSGTLTNKIEQGFSDVIGLFEDVGETITDIYDTVVEKVGSIDLSLDSILEGVQSIVESIETAAVDLFSDFLSAIQSIFAPILGRIRGALGIWHYVVEWLNCIGGVFTWIFGLCSGTAYCMVVPIYASIAAAICIALYKRFGR